MKKYETIFNISLQTWSHSQPTETPSRVRAKAVCSQEDARGVRLRVDYWRLEVVGLGGVHRGVAAAVVHQDRSVSVCDPDIVVLASWLPLNSKVGELES